MSSHAITRGVGAMYRCKPKRGLRRSPRSFHTRTRLSSLPKFNLVSTAKTSWYHSAAVLSRRARHVSKRGHAGRMSLLAYVMSTAICNVQQSTLQRYATIQGSVVKSLPVFRYCIVINLALLVREEWCDGPSCYWSGEGALSLDGIMQNLSYTLVSKSPHIEVRTV